MPLTSLLRASVSKSTYFQRNVIRNISNCSNSHPNKNANFRRQLSALISSEDSVADTRVDFTDVLEKNAVFAKQKDELFPDFFPITGKVQRPKYLYIGCSDARVNPNALLGFEHDEVFVTRNIGNQVAPGDLNTQAVLEFSLGVLLIPHVIVCGHTECGAVKAALAQSGSGGVGYLEHWIRHLRDTKRHYAKELDQIQDQVAKENKMAELNVREGCYNVLKAPVVQRLRRESLERGCKVALPIVHGAVYDVKTGLLSKVDVDFKDEELYKVY